MTATLAVPTEAVIPQLPRTLADTGLAPDHVEQLILKTLYTGEMIGTAIAEAMRLPFSILEPLIERARAERLLEVRGATGTGSAGYRYTLTDMGRDRTREYLNINGYIGPAPVPLNQYCDTMKRLQAARGFVERDRLRGAFSHLIISDSLLEQLGPAVNANKAIFLYGPPRNGKSVVAEGMGRAMGGDIYVPHALDVDGAVITMFDPIAHESLEIEEDAFSVVADAPRDRRWVRIKRPVVVVGGELTLSMLDLTFNQVSKFYEAPVQLKANGGVLLVDDFGRQRMRPEDLLNRWIVPLESRIDFLTLHTGKKFQVPFDVLVSFATNLDPPQLADEAFLRRIPYKVPIQDPTAEQFARIFELNCRKYEVEFDRDMLLYLHARHYTPVSRPLRACQPRDLIEQVVALCRYRGVKPVLTTETLDAACT